MPMWMQAINASSATVTVTPPAGEVWMLNSWTGLNTAGVYVRFGTANVTLGLTGGANGTTVLDSFGSRTTLAPVFTNATPLRISPSGTTTGVVTGFKFTTATAPYTPLELSATGVSAGGRLSLQPPVGKVWRLIAGGGSGNLVNVATDATPSWVSTVNRSDFLVGGRGDLWSWRDKPLAIRAGAGPTNLYAYVLEFNESDFLSSRVYGSQSIAASGTYDIRPPAGEEWVLDGLYMSQSYSLTQMVAGSPVGTAISWGNAQYAAGPFRLDNSSYLRVTNTDTFTGTLVYLGRKVN